MLAPLGHTVVEAGDGAQGLEKAKSSKPNLVITDLNMPVMNGLEAAREIIEKDPRTKIVMLTVHDSDSMIHKVLGCGARGYVFKTDAARDLVNAVKAMQGDNTFFTGKVAEVILNGFTHNQQSCAYGGDSPAGRLTARQREITQLLAEGRSTKEVASLLELSVKTAETHRANIMRRLSCHSVAELVRYAVRNQIIEA